MLAPVRSIYRRQFARCAAPGCAWADRAAAYFLGNYPQLKNPDLTWRKDDRFRLRTVSAGAVHLHVNVLTREMERHGVEMGSKPQAKNVYA